jgi:glycosyltransferase involved in cell wall biosynthesis
MSLALFLKGRHYDVECLSPLDDYVGKINKSGIKHTSIEMDNKGSNPVKDVFLFVSFFLKYLKIKPDLIIHYTIKPNIYGTLAAVLLRIKSVAVVTGLGFAFIKRGWTTKLVILLYKIAFAFNSKVVFLNETDRTFFCRLRIVKREKTLVIPGEGINTSYFSPSQLEKINPFTFLFIGRLLFDKGLGELIDATRKLRKYNQEFKVQIVGFLDALNPTAVSESELKMWIEEGLVEYLGHKTDVREAISNASCIVLPSYREGIPRTLLEASSMTKPIVTTDVVGCRDVVVHEKTGIICKAKNHESLRQAMFDMLHKSVEKLAEMGKEGRLFVSQNFSEERVFSIYEHFIGQLLGYSDKNNLNEDLIPLSQTKVSIVTVSYQGARFIKDAIESVLSQTYADVQYIVIDGGSTDGSLDIIQSYTDRISIIVSEPDEGIYDAMNKGLALASGEVVAFLNADDFYAHSSVIEHAIGVFQKTNADVVYADLDYVSRTDKSKVVRKWRSGEFGLNRFKQGWMPPHPTFFAKRSLYQQFGGYKQELNSSADYELMLRFCFVNRAKVAYLPEVLVKMRLGGQSNRSFKNRLLANLQDRKAWEINNIKPTWYTFLMKPLSKVKQYFI